MAYEPQPGDIPAGKIDANGDPDGFMRDGVYYGIRKPFALSFFAYETIGATIPHTGTVVKTDDPALMDAIAKGEAEGRVVIDEHGGITILTCLDCGEKLTDNTCTNPTCDLCENKEAP